MSEKLRMSSSEISQLLDLLEQQRAVMDYMLETHELERDQFLDEIDDLKDALVQVETTASTHKTNAEKLTGDLEKAHGEGVAARAETLRAKASIKEEETKKDRFLELLNMEKQKVIDLEKKHEEALKEQQATRGNIDSADEMTKSEVARLESEKQTLSESHERALKDLLSKHSEEVKQIHSKHDQALQDHRKKVEKDSEELKVSHESDLEDFAEHVTELEEQITAQIEEKAKLHTEIETRQLQVTNLTQQLQKAFSELAERGSEGSSTSGRTSSRSKEMETNLEALAKEKSGFEQKLSQMNSLHQARLNELFEQKEALKRAHENEKSDLQLVIDSKTQEFAGIREEAANIKAAHANDAEELEAMREMHEKLESDNSELLAKLQAKEEELEKLNKPQADATSSGGSPGALNPHDTSPWDQAGRTSSSSDRSDKVSTEEIEFRNLLRSE